LAERGVSEKGILQIDAHRFRLEGGIGTLSRKSVAPKMPLTAQKRKQSLSNTKLIKEERSENAKKETLAGAAKGNKETSEQRPLKGWRKEWRIPIDTQEQRKRGHTNATTLAPMQMGYNLARGGEPCKERTDSGTARTARYKQ